MEPRITSLEISMADLKEIVAETSRQMAQNSREIREMQEKSDRESAKFRADMNKMQEERRKHNLEMGRIANRQGRMAEDFVAPSICRIMKEALGIDKKIPCIDNFRAKRAYRGDTSKIREFDVIAECLDYALVNETKSSPTPADVNELIESMGVIRDYFPEFKDRKLIGAIASLFLNTSLINYASAKGILALAVGDDLMDIKNPAGFKPSFW